jgi:uncharacterized integral membrane protein
MSTKTRPIIAIVASVLVIVLILLNLHIVTVKFVIADIRMPAAVLIAVCVILGFAIGAGSKKRA